VRKSTDPQDELIAELRLWWERAFGPVVEPGPFGELVAAYRAAGRHYHNLRHIHHCLREAQLVSDRLVDPTIVIAAIFYHDAVYDPTRSDNEERSADLAERELRAMGKSEPFIAEVRDLILDTRHQVSPESNDGRYLVDIDLAILGAPAAEFDAYERAIRREYAHVPEEAFRAGRAKVLQSFIDRPRVYGTDVFHDRYEGAARANLARSLAALGAPPAAGGGTMSA
jgi:predicted metal-dependent HD superfamily phosphohydrolase